MKIKNILLMAILSICTLAMVGVVNAESFTIGNNLDVICRPDTIEAGDRSTCYIIGIPGTTEGSVHGYVTHAYTTKNLSIKLASNNPNIINSAAVYTGASETTEKPFSAIPNVPESLKDFTCIYDASGINVSNNDFKCVVYYSTTDANAYTPSSLRNNVSSLQNFPEDKAAAGYGVVGSITVELASDANSEECGKLCVKLWQIPDKADYANYKECASGSSGGITCESTTKWESSNYTCSEIHLKGYQPEAGPPTGAFASYTILAAGALIAISAIALAKKNNKFNRI